MRGDYLSRPSTSPLTVTCDGKELIWTMCVQGHGLLTLRATGDPYTGRLTFNSLSILPNEST